MVKPMKEISKIIEDKYNCKISIRQGGSQDLYDELKLSKKGDIYLPGSDSYRKKNLKDGFLKDKQYIGFNQAAIFVQKTNPKHIKNLDSLVDSKISSMIVNPESGSIGKMTRKTLIKYKGEDFYNDVFDLTIKIGTDSRNINKALIDKKIDMSINWRATGYFKENKPYVDVIDIDEKYAPKKKLVLNMLSFSKHKDIVKNFMKFASSKDGKDIMRKYGFLK
jgi:molybdate transport system substrate-binding protein